MTTRWINGRLRTWMVRLIYALAPVLAIGSWLALKQNANDVNDWLPVRYAATVEYKWFLNYFNTDEFVLISWDGCTLEDPRLDQLADLLQPSKEVPRSGTANLIRRVVTGPSILRRLTAPPINLPRDVAIRRLTGLFIGRDHNQTCAIVELTSQARSNLHPTLKDLRQSIVSVGVPATSIRLGGSPVVNDAMDAISVRSMTRAIFFTCSLSVLIAWVCIRDVRLTAFVLLSGLLSMGASLSILPLCGVHLNATLFTMVPMVYASAVSGAIHLCNYYRQAIREKGIDGAADRAVQHAWIPLSLATGTTAAGLLSICYSDLQPIQQFGLFSAIGVGLSWFLLVLWLPSALSVLPIGAAGEISSTGESENTGEAPLPLFWKHVCNFVLSHHRLMTLACIALLLACAPGLYWFDVSIDLMHELPEDCEVMRDFVWLEEKVAFLTPVEVVIRIPDGSPLSMLERLELVRRIQNRLALQEHVGGTMSVASFVPEFEAEGTKLFRRVAIKHVLNKQRRGLLESQFLADGHAEELWRITLRAASLRKLDFGSFTDRVEEHVLQEFRSERYRGVTAVYTGLSPAVFKGRRSLVDGLIWGLVTDVLLIFGAVLVLMRSWSSGLLMIIASIFPTGIVLGLVGWFGIEVHAGAVLAPCVALGVTVDDVIHFVIWFRNGVQQGLDRTQALQLAWQACARPMYQSWALLGLGLGTLLLCDFTSIRQFGITMAAMLTTGLLGNLILVPALLAGRLGKFVCSHHLPFSPQAKDSCSRGTQCRIPERPGKHQTHDAG